MRPKLTKFYGVVGCVELIFHHIVTKLCFSARKGGGRLVFEKYYQLERLIFMFF